MSDANRRQEGGRHYEAEDGLQHWDLAIIHHWDYFQAQIIKYVMRWKHKHAGHKSRVMDLKKARHFLDKYIENAHLFDDRMSMEEVCELMETMEGMPIADMDLGEEPGTGYVDQDRESCPPGFVRLRPGGPCVPDTGAQRR